MSNLHPDTLAEVSYSAQGPRPVVWLEAANLRVVLVGLEPGQSLPAHPGPAGMYHFQAGATVAAPEGARRGVEAATRLAMLAVRAQAQAG